LYKPVISALPQMLQTLGTDYADRVLPSIANETMASVVAQFTAAELITRREKVSQVIKTKLIERAKEFSIILDDVSITDLTFASEYAAAVEAKQVAQQEAARAKYLVEKAIQDKEETIVRAQGEAQAATLFNKQLRDDPQGNFLALRRIGAAKEIAQHLAMGANRVFLTTDTLLLNTVGSAPSKSLVDEVVSAVTNRR
jgi:prohibitin 2